MKRIAIAAVAIAIGSSLAAGLAGASAGGLTLQLRKTSVGTILVNGRGFTVYAYTADGRNVDAWARENGCLNVWPPLTSASRPVLGPGLRSSLVGRIKVKGVGEQLTYAGHPLYIYSSDSRPGQTNWVNVFQFKGRWPGLGSSGQGLK